MTAPIHRENVRCTLVIPCRGRSILLARKARGLGKGKWVGFGGKFEPGETPMQANYREMLEETGVRVDDAKKCGLLLFTFDCEPGLFIEVHVFRTAKSFDNVTLDGEFEGTSPTWFHENDIPFEQMWPDFPLWCAHIFERRRFRARISYSDFDTVTSSHIRVLGQHDDDHLLEVAPDWL